MLGMNTAPVLPSDMTGLAAVMSCLEAAAPVTPTLPGNGSLPAMKGDIPDYLTDVRMAELFIQVSRYQLKYWHDAGEWLDYVGGQWKPNTPGGPFKYIKPMLDPMLALAEMENDKEELLKALLTRESMSGQKNMIAAAEKIPAVCVVTDDLDKDKMLLNCLNGTVNLETGVLQPHSPEDFITKSTHITYDPAATCPTFDKFLSRIMNQDTEMIGYMQRWIGYTLTGYTNEHIVQIRYGTGANGKSVLSRVEGELLGDYTKTAGCFLLLKQSDGGRDLTSQAELAKLRGVRSARISEIDEGARLAEAQLKNITGEDTVTCRTLYGKPFEYNPLFKISLSCNHMPQVKGTDNGIWRRLHKIPFLVTIPKEEQDHNLFDKLKAEMAGILNWAIAGCLEWQKQGLNPPEAVIAATKEYQTSEDAFACWLDECCSVGSQYSAKAKDLLQSFKDYSGWKDMKTKKFGTMLSNHGFNKYTSNGVVWQGLEPLEPSDTNADKSNWKPPPKQVSENASPSSNSSEVEFEDEL